jgi:hypothetical protein
VNYIRNSPFQDDTSIFNIVSVLAALIKWWKLNRNQAAVNLESFEKVSCKLDALLLITMARPYSKIRPMCIQILVDFNAIQTNTMSGKPLCELLVDNDVLIRKKALYAFFEKQNNGAIIIAKNVSGMTLPSFYQIAASEYSSFFNYYLAELAVLFSKYGRDKATRHCAKFLVSLAVPKIGAILPVNSTKAILHFCGMMNLVMALSGTPVDYF